MRSSQPSASQDAPAPGSSGSWQSETDAALLERLAGPAADGVGERLLSRHGGLREVFRALGDAGQENPAAERVCLQRLAAAAELCRRRLLRELVRGEPLTSPASTVEFLQNHLLDRGREIFIAVFLDTRHRVLSAEELFQGSIDGACVYPRVVADRALRLGAAAVIVAHNHPSGIAEPSLADQAITRRLKDALALLEIRLLDHFIIGNGTPVSLAGRGLL
jgi:DNA repair protein RadC